MPNSIWETMPREICQFFRRGKTVSCPYVMTTQKVVGRDQHRVRDPKRGWNSRIQDDYRSLLDRGSWVAVQLRPVDQFPYDLRGPAEASPPGTAAPQVAPVAIFSYSPSRHPLSLPSTLQPERCPRATAYNGSIGYDPPRHSWRSIGPWPSRLDPQPRLG